MQNDKQEKERKGDYGGRKGSQRKQLQLARASKGKVVESSTRHLPKIRHHRSLILSVAVTDTVRSIIIITTTTAGSDTILSACIIVCSASLHYTADNLGEISKLLVLCAEY